MLTPNSKIGLTTLDYIDQFCTDPWLIAPIKMRKGLNKMFTNFSESRASFIWFLLYFNKYSKKMAKNCKERIKFWVMRSAIITDLCYAAETERNSNYVQVGHFAFYALWKGSPVNLAGMRGRGGRSDQKAVTANHGLNSVKNRFRWSPRHTAVRAFGTTNIKGNTV